MSDINEKIVTMLRNFPSHVGDYDQELPARECSKVGGDSCDESIFRLGWSCAVEAINDRITDIQKNEPHGSLWEFTLQTKDGTVISAIRGCEKDFPDLPAIIDVKRKYPTATITNIQAINPHMPEIT